jgi:hypothetical protein
VEAAIAGDARSRAEARSVGAAAAAAIEQAQAAAVQGLQVFDRAQQAERVRHAEGVAAWRQADIAASERARVAVATAAASQVEAVLEAERAAAASSASDADAVLEAERAAAATAADAASERVAEAERRAAELAVQLAEFERRTVEQEAERTAAARAAELAAVVEQVERAAARQKQEAAAEAQTAEAAVLEAVAAEAGVKERQQAATLLEQAAAAVAIEVQRAGEQRQRDRSAEEAMAKVERGRKMRQRGGGRPTAARHSISIFSDDDDDDGQANSGQPAGQLFAAFDADGDGVISRAEFEAALGRGGRARPDRPLPQQSASPLGRKHRQQYGVYGNDPYAGPMVPAIVTPAAAVSGEGDLEDEAKTLLRELRSSQDSHYAGDLGPHLRMNATRGKILTPLANGRLAGRQGRATIVSSCNARQARCQTEAGRGLPGAGCGRGDLDAGAGGRRTSTPPRTHDTGRDRHMLAGGCNRAASVALGRRAAGALRACRGAAAVAGQRGGGSRAEAGPRAGCPLAAVQPGTTGAARLGSRGENGC